MRFRSFFLSFQDLCFFNFSCLREQGLGCNPRLAACVVNSLSVVLYSGREPRPAPDVKGRALIAFKIMCFSVAFFRVRKHPDYLNLRFSDLSSSNIRFFSFCGSCLNNSSMFFSSWSSLEAFNPPFSLVLSAM